MRVFISGGGIAGLTLAYWLNRYQIDVVVLEQADGMRRDGYGIDFFGTGYDVAERMGIVDALRERQALFEAVMYVDQQDHLRAIMEAAFLRKIMNGKYLGLMHWTLEEVLYQAIHERVEVRFGTSIARLEEHADGLEITLQDGTRERCDLLIGADGVHSLTRKLVFGSEEQFSHYLGYEVASYRLPDRYGIGQAWKMCVEPGRLAGVYCSDEAGQLISFFMYSSQERRHPPAELRLQHLRDVFAGMGWHTQDMLADAPASSDIFMDVLKQIRMPTWHRGRVALVGDACDCPTLASGQGASLAMGGAYMLAEALHQYDDYREAFTRYEQRMKPHVERQQRSGRGLAKSMLPTTAFGVFFQHFMLNVLMRESFIWLLRRSFHAKSILA